MRKSNSENCKHSPTVGRLVSAGRGLSLPGSCLGGPPSPPAYVPQALVIYAPQAINDLMSVLGKCQPLVYISFQGSHPTGSCTPRANVQLGWHFQCLLTHFKSPGHPYPLTAPKILVSPVHISPPTQPAAHTASLWTVFFMSLSLEAPHLNKCIRPWCPPSCIQLQGLPHPTLLSSLHLVSGEVLPPFIPLKSEFMINQFLNSCRQ